MRRSVRRRATFSRSSPTFAVFPPRTWNDRPTRTRNASSRREGGAPSGSQNGRCRIRLALDVLENERGEGEAEDGRRVGDGAVAVRLVRREPVLSAFGAPHAGELPFGESARLLEPLAERAGEPVAFDLAELRRADLKGVHLERGTHRGEERDGRNREGVEDQRRLAGDRVDGVDRVIEGFESEGRGARLVVDLLTDVELHLRIDLAEALGEDLDLDPALGLRGRHQLAVHVGEADAVGVDEEELADPRADERFGAPAADAAESDDRDLRRHQGVERSLAEQEFRASEDGGVWHGGHYTIRPPARRPSCPAVWYNLGVCASDRTEELQKPREGNDEQEVVGRCAAAAGGVCGLGLVVVADRKSTRTDRRADEEDGTQSPRGGDPCARSG